jgi:HK97 family phage prohead protease
MPTKKRTAAAPAPQVERRVYGLQDCRIESRAMDPAIKGYLRDDRGDVRTFTGYASVWNSLSVDLGGFREIVRDSAFDSSLTNENDVRFLINHDSNQVLGRTRSGTCTLSKDEKGLRVDCPLPDTSFARDLAVSMDRGDIDQMSFGFRAQEDAWNDRDASSGLPIRDLVQADLFDVSVVTFPAYPETSAECRDAATAANNTIALKASNITAFDEAEELPLAPLSTSWDGESVLSDLRAHLALEQPTTDFARCVLWHDREASTDFDSYRFPIATVVDGAIAVVPAGIAEAARQVHRARELSSDDRGALRSTLDQWFALMKEELGDDAPIAPWVGGVEGFSRAKAESILEAITALKADLEGRDLSDTHKDTIASTVEGMQNLTGDLQSMLDADQDADPVETYSHDDDVETGDAQANLADRVTDRAAELELVLGELLPASRGYVRPNFIAYRRAMQAEERDWGYDDDWQVYLLTQMIALGSSFMCEEECEVKWDDRPEDAADVSAMQTILTQLAELLGKEISEELRPPTAAETKSEQAAEEQAKQAIADQEERDRRSRRLRLAEHELDLQATTV